MAEQRIQKVLSDQGVCSRRAAEKLIDEGRVKVNGHPVTLGDKMDPDFDKVSIDGKSVRIVRKRQYTYLMLNKPRGYITTASDERGRKTVMDLLTGVDRRVYPIGRLDKDSEPAHSSFRRRGQAVPRYCAPPRDRGTGCQNVQRRCAGRWCKNPARRHPCCGG